MTKFTKEQLIEEAKQAVEGCRRLLRVSPGVEAHKISLRLAEITLAALRAEPVAIVEPSDYVTAAQLVGECSARKAVHELYEGALRIGDKLYRHATPAPVSVPTFEEWCKRTEQKPVGWVRDAMKEAYEGCRAAMLQGKAEPVSQHDELPHEPQIAAYEKIMEQAIPDGYALVPVEMTDEIGEVIAREARCCGGIALDIYDAILLAAAPQQE